MTPEEFNQKSEFNSALCNWLEAVRLKVLNPQVNDKWLRYFGRPYIRLEIDNGQKFVRIVSLSETQRSCWAFVATCSGGSKTLGQWKYGDIFKPATWSAPSRHARGNIFDLSQGETCGIVKWTGPSYLR